ncbi:uncharacterized protein SOCEGT47_068140 [Sorangium cellulosum]|uniref:Uncharacterized protein n=1 Tax=Sorangium cellulosum TaxID=56 RepID=A0A4P2QAY0_SORCE|nr:hypothetical protein [Sorangium cellulosum]AUX26253.1 uncharacterized protein SOCEGT47_068140 [Sorangium cellulosum]
MLDDDKLSPDLVWQPDGHLTEIALGALGDGEEALLPEGALAHAARCLPCASALGRAALLSLRVGEALREQAAPGAEEPAALREQAAPGAQAAPEPVAPREPLPIAALAVALALSALGAAPGLVAGASGLKESWDRLWRACSVVVQTGCAIAGNGALSGGLTALPWLSAALLVVVGLGIAWGRGNELSLKGGIGCASSRSRPVCCPRGAPPRCSSPRSGSR